MHYHENSAFAANGILKIRRFSNNEKLNFTGLHMCKHTHTHAYPYNVARR